MSSQMRRFVSLSSPPTHPSVESGRSTFPVSTHYIALRSTGQQLWSSNGRKYHKYRPHSRSCSCGQAPRCFSKIRIISEWWSASPGSPGLGGGFGGGAAGSLYAVGEGTARVIYLTRNTVTRGARAVWCLATKYNSNRFFFPSKSDLQNSWSWRRQVMTSYILSRVHSRRGDIIASNAPERRGLELWSSFTEG